MDIRGDAGITEGPGQDGVEIPIEHGKTIGRNRHPVAKIAVGAPVEFAQLDVGSRCADDLESLQDHFLANPVSGDDGDALPGRWLRVHGRKANTRRAE